MKAADRSLCFRCATSSLHKFAALVNDKLLLGRVGDGCGVERGEDDDWGGRAGDETTRAFPLKYPVPTNGADAAKSAPSSQFSSLFLTGDIYDSRFGLEDAVGLVCSRLNTVVLFPPLPLLFMLPYFPLSKPGDGNLSDDELYKALPFVMVDLMYFDGTRNS